MTRQKQGFRTFLGHRHEKSTELSTKCLILLKLFGGEEEDRTPDLCIANAALSQLSYPPQVVTV